MFVELSSKKYCSNFPSPTNNTKVIKTKFFPLTIINMLGPWTIERRIEECFPKANINWDTRKENSMFQLQELRRKMSEPHSCDNFQVGAGYCLYCSCKQYRINTHTKLSVVICKTDEINEVVDCWNELEQLIPMFASYYLEECRKNPLQHKKRTILENQNVIELLFTKVSALIREENKYLSKIQLSDEREIRVEFSDSFDAVGVYDSIIHCKSFIFQYFQ